ncbi:hypothetical protein JW964_21510 [candidate division KSB1 bacterium]|nr:hypothetical protein [candidate division KSB1 bacterium]
MKKGHYILNFILCLSLFLTFFAPLLDDPSHFLKPDPDCQLCQISQTQFISNTLSYYFPYFISVEFSFLLLNENIPVSYHSHSTTPRAPPSIS